MYVFSLKIKVKIEIDSDRVIKSADSRFYVRCDVIKGQLIRPLLH